VASPPIEERIDELCHEYGEGGVEDALLVRLLRKHHGLSESMARIDVEGRLDDRAWLDVAALLATRRGAIESKGGLVRDWLALFALRDRLIHSVDIKHDRAVDQMVRFMRVQTELQREVVRTVWKEPMLRPAGVAAVLGWRGAYHDRIRRYRLRSWLVGFLRDGAYHYLAFQFDADRHEVFPEAVMINERLEAASDPWGVASWWISANDRLGAPPADLLGTERTTDLVDAADAELEPIG
jgi:hypothetical protein